MGLPLTTQLAAEYQQLFDTCAISPSKYTDTDAAVDRIVKGKDKYLSVATAAGVPWYFVGILHCMEGSCNFTTHLHNGDPLTARTVQVPKGCPKTGAPPFAWTSSAEDALRMKKFDTWTDWSVPGLLYKMELYNGIGYRVRGINTPYLWSFSNQYTRGKFTSDGFYNPNAVSKQVGAAVLLRRMAERQLAVVGELDVITQIKNLGATVSYAPATFQAGAEKLQQLLTTAGQPLKADGFAGKFTSEAYRRVSGKYLKGDPRQV